MTASPARQIALKVAARVRERSAFAHETLDAVLAATPGLDQRDRALATRLAYGAIATRGTLDEALDRLVDRPSRVEPKVRDALQIAAWELLFGGVDPHVAVNEGVELVRSVRPHASGLANAVLRRLAEESSTFPWGDPVFDANALARKYGHPRWIVDLLADELGRAAGESVLAANNAPAPTYLALLGFSGGEKPGAGDTSRAARTWLMLENAGAEPRECELDGCVRIGRPAALVDSGVIEAGLAEVCDAGAQFAVHAARPRPGQGIVEIGAGRGTKTLLLQSIAISAGGPSSIWAVDSHRFKLDVLARRVANLGAPAIEPVQADGAALPFGTAMPSEGTVDAVLVDAPCSGLGTLRRHPDKRWRLHPDEIERLALLGERLLSEASRLVRPGGFVVYSTCTLSKRENREVVERFLAGGPGAGFAIEDLTPDVPAAWMGFVTDTGWFQSLPAPGGPDGHFVARLRREG